MHHIGYLHERAHAHIGDTQLIDFFITGECPKVGPHNQQGQKRLSNAPIPKASSNPCVTAVSASSCFLLSQIPGNQHIHADANPDRRRIHQCGNREMTEKQPSAHSHSTAPQTRCLSGYRNIAGTWRSAAVSTFAR